MKALSLTQPWAGLVATSQKKNETRSWNTRYRGPLYIHAAKGFPRYAKEFALEVLGNPAILPYNTRGTIIAKTYLLDVCHVEDLTALTIQEAKYGDYSPGRYVWMFGHTEQLEPIPWRGQLGLFEVHL